MIDFKSAIRGDKIFFGRYPQAAADVQRRNGIIKFNAQQSSSYAGAFVLLDGNDAPHTVCEKDILPIEWRVLSNDGQSLFLISEKSLDYMPFHHNRDGAMHFHDWDNSTIREWLNTFFYDIAFTDAERHQIKVTLCVDNSSTKKKKFNLQEWIDNANRWYGERVRTEEELRKIAYRHDKKYEVSDTLDKVFLLNEKEANELLCKENIDKAAQLTDFGVKRAGTLTGQFDDEGEFGFPWWLRTVNRINSNVGYACRYGIRAAGNYAHSKAIRPAIKIDLTDGSQSENYMFKVHNPSRDLKKEEIGQEFYIAAKQLLFDGKEKEAEQAFVKARECGSEAAFYSLAYIFKINRFETEFGDYEWRPYRELRCIDEQNAVSWSKIDPELAFWFYKNLAAKDNLNAMFCLGYMYYEPHIRGDYFYFETQPKTDEQYNGVFTWWEKAAARGHFMAQALLGEVYECDCARADQEKAFYWYQKAAMGRKFDGGEPGEGHSCGRIQCKLAHMYSEGRGTKKDLKKALYWAEKAYVLNDYRKADWIYYNLALNAALRFATKAHKNQLYKDSGLPYLNHIKKVADYCGYKNEKIVALLHGVIEDAKATLDDLRKSNFSETTVVAVDCLSKRDGEDTDDFMRRIASNDVAIAVMFASMRYKSEINYQEHFDKAKRLATLIGEKRTQQNTTEETYNWLNQ